MNHCSSRAYTDIEVSKYHKICLGKIIFWPWVLKTSEASVTKIAKLENFEGSIIWLKQAWDWEYQPQKYFRSSFLLSIFNWLGFDQRIWWNINWNKAYLATFRNFFRVLLLRLRFLYLSGFSIKPNTICHQNLFKQYTMHSFILILLTTI